MPNLRSKRFEFPVSNINLPYVLCSTSRKYGYFNENVLSDASTKRSTRKLMEMKIVLQKNSLLCIFVNKIYHEKLILYYVQ